MNLALTNVSSKPLAITYRIVGEAGIIVQQELTLQGHQTLRGGETVVIDVKRLPAKGEWDVNGDDFPRRAVRVSGRTYYCFTRTVNVPSLKGRVRLVVVHERADRSDEVRLLVTNRVDWSAHQILRRYGHRWAIERGYRAAKRVLGFSADQLRRMAGIATHGCLVWLADSLLPLCRAVGVPQRAARRFLRSTEALHHAAKRHLLEGLVDHIWQMSTEHRRPEFVTRALAAYV